MLLVHPAHELLRQLPLLIGSVVLGSATGNQTWSAVVLGLLVVFGVARWFTTTYRIDGEQIQRREGVLRRTVTSLPRNRIRSVSTDARLLHRLLGLTVVKVSTGREVKGDAEFALDAVQAADVPALRAILLADSLAPKSEVGPPPSRVIARWQPSWLRYSPLSFTGLAMIAAAVGVVYQTGVAMALRDSALARQGVDAAERFGVVVTVAIGVGGLLLLSVVLSVVRSLVTFGNLVLSRRDDHGGAGVLHLEHGLLRARESTFDMRRLRGGTIREPALVRMFGGSRLDAVMTGVDGAGEASLLLPPCPAATVRDVLSEVTGRPDVVRGELRRHGRAATRRRWTRALSIPVALGVAMAGATVVVEVPPVAWVTWALATVLAGVLAADRARSLGHRAGDGWLVAQAGSMERRRDCIAAAGVIGWTVRQTLFQRRAGVATLVAATAAGVKGYRVLDVPAEVAWSVAASASPWLIENDWASARRGPSCADTFAV
ncbi:PH domain-containing protein [Mycobacterium yunnanensis]|uniref:PH domain-containing protein n=1 Tax=Mycobacterium yunnanensis TaxID=368477 RepID=A0A9X2Z1C4_9MYCO|nr:PH domain-containing protein [Mycobacterium yunnanensis]MCV7421141.1 PH domain-containing protein [Mycobacterium yunnanensis]